jgi:hypothetical protein
MSRGKAWTVLMPMCERMGTFSVLAGDFPKSPTATVVGETLRMPRPPSWRMLVGVTKWEPFEVVHAAEIASLEVVGQVSGKSFGGAAAAGVAGGLLLGGVGAVAGLLAGGNRDAVTFQLTLLDGRRVLGSAKSAVYQEIMAAEFDCRGQTPPPRVEARPLTRAGLALRVGLVAALLIGVYVGVSILFEM